jgi:hydroxypyruvate isomerase
MTILAANLSTLFTELPFLDRFAAAANAGFGHVEYQFPYSFGSAAEIAAAARGAGVDVVLHNIFSGDASKGERGLACQPANVARFREGVDQALEYALAVSCPRINALAGVAPEGEHDAAWETMVENVRFAADKFATAGIRLLVEAVNARSVPGFLLNTSKQAISLIDAAGRPNVFFQYDVFHMQVSEGDLSKTIERLLPRIGHFQIADAPGRHEPGTGEINFAWLLAEIERLGYAGPIGCEYFPAGETLAGLGWARPYLR